MKKKCSIKDLSVEAFQVLERERMEEELEKEI